MTETISFRLERSEAVNLTLTVREWTTYMNFVTLVQRCTAKNGTVLLYVNNFIKY